MQAHCIASTLVGLSRFAMAPGRADATGAAAVPVHHSSRSRGGMLKVVSEFEALGKGPFGDSADAVLALTAQAEGAVLVPCNPSARAWSRCQGQPVSIDHQARYGRRNR